ncbi:MAG TPA: hypothetical protein VJR06_03640 [Nitrososphaerales archaeon]|nr:hypothetical protein [Nitrososphaerales archaeon]
MSDLASRSLFVGAAVLIVVGVFVTAGMVPGSTGPTTGQNNVSVASVDGLSLALRISTTALGRGGSIVINVTETNANSSPLNESAASHWAIGGLRMNACYSSIYPFGAGVFDGHYAEQNISSAKPLNLYPLLPCPLLIRYISGYYFQPSSDLALVLPGSGSSTAMTSGLSSRGNFTSGTNVTYFAPGQYTVVAGDEWGSLAFLYFTVS